MTSEATNTVTRFSDSDRHSLALLLNRYGLVPELVGFKNGNPGFILGGRGSRGWWETNSCCVKTPRCIPCCMRPVTTFAWTKRGALAWIPMQAAIMTKRMPSAIFKYYWPMNCRDLAVEQMLSDMDAWGYTFRLGSARAWFEEDAGDARAWLLSAGIISASGKPTFKIRE